MSDLEVTTDVYLAHSDRAVLKQVRLILCLSYFPELDLELILHAATSHCSHLTHVKMYSQFWCW